MSSLIILLSLSLPQYANAVLLPNTLTGTMLDTEKPLLPQFEKALDDIKQKESLEQFDARLENISTVLGELIAACSNPLTQSLMGTQCDTGMSLSGIFCMGGKYKEEVFECANPAINDYLKANQITDPEAYVRFGLEKAVREGNATS
jgi:hypothetical protein